MYPPAGWGVPLLCIQFCAPQDVAVTSFLLGSKFTQRAAAFASSAIRGTANAGFKHPKPCASVRTSSAQLSGLFE